LDFIVSKRITDNTYQVFKDIAGNEGLYEIRVKVGTNIYRFYSFFDKGNLVVIANGFQKKTQKRH
jgi:phage-related protein